MANGGLSLCVLVSVVTNWVITPSDMLLHSPFTWLGWTNTGGLRAQDLTHQVAFLPERYDFC